MFSSLISFFTFTVYYVVKEKNNFMITGIHLNSIFMLHNFGKHRFHSLVIKTTKKKNETHFDKRFFNKTKNNKLNFDLNFRDDRFRHFITIWE